MSKKAEAYFMERYLIYVAFYFTSERAMSLGRSTLPSKKKTTERKAM